MSDERKPRVEVVVRIVRDDADKPQAEGPPEFRRVLYEIAVPIRTEFDFSPPPGADIAEMLAMTDADIMLRMSGPMVEEMQKLPLPMMFVQCVQGLSEKLRSRLVGMVRERPAS